MSSEQLPQTSLQAAVAVVKRFDPVEWNEEQDETTGKWIVWGKSPSLLSKYYPAPTAAPGVRTWSLFLSVDPEAGAFVCSTPKAASMTSELWTTVATGLPGGPMRLADVPSAVGFLQLGDAGTQNRVGVVAIPAFQLHCALGQECDCLFSKNELHFRWVVSVSALVSAARAFDRTDGMGTGSRWLHTTRRHGIHPRLHEISSQKVALFDVLRTSATATKQDKQKKRTAKTFEGRGCFTLEQMMKGKRTKKETEDTEDTKAKEREQECTPARDPGDVSSTQDEAQQL